MKAFLLAGGLGERLYPLTKSMPKCMVRVDGVPLLEVWLDLCAQHGINEVLLNVSQHPSLVREFLERRQGAPRVQLVIERAPLGTAGTVRQHRDFVAGDQDFWILYADTLTDADLTTMLSVHRAHKEVFTMGLFHAPVPSAAGIVDLAPNGRICGFVEKPPSPIGDLANAGIGVARSELIDLIPARPLADFGQHVLPGLVGRMHGHVIPEFVLDIGTPAALAVAQATWPRRPRTRGVA